VRGSAVRYRVSGTQASVQFVYEGVNPTSTTKTLSRKISSCKSFRTYAAAFVIEGSKVLPCSSPLNHGEVRLQRKRGPDILLFACSPAKPGGHHGPLNGILPQSGVPCQKAYPPKQDWHPLAQGQTVPVYRVPQDVQSHERYCVVPSAHHRRPSPL
jgi:hypothetical protein